MTNLEFDKIRRVHDRMARHFSEGDRAAYFKLNHEIHLMLVVASRNSVLQEVHASLMVRARRARYAALSRPSRWVEAMAEHEELMRALAQRDGRRAGEIMQQHDRRTARMILEALNPATADAQRMSADCIRPSLTEAPTPSPIPALPASGIAR